MDFDIDSIIREVEDATNTQWKKEKEMETDNSLWTSLEGSWVEDLEKDSLELKCLNITLTVLDAEFNDLEALNDMDVEFETTEEIMDGIVKSITFFKSESKNYSVYLTLHELKDGSMVIENHAREYPGGTISSFIRKRA